MPDALDPVPLLKHLHEHGVEHIIIGGLAVSAHGHVRPSKDLDIVPDPAHENLKRLTDALCIGLTQTAIGRAWDRFLAPDRGVPYVSQAEWRISARRGSTIISTRA
jgi:hypothetical protein